MREPNHERFTAANDLLRGLLQRLGRESNSAGSVSEGDLKSVEEQVSKVPAEVGAASWGATLDAYLQHEIAEYVHNLLALQTVLEKMHFLALARKLIGV